MLPEGVRPRPPMSPAQRSEMMSPYRLGMHSTSNCVGFFTSCMHALSTIISRYSMSGYFSPAWRARAHDKTLDTLSS